LSHSDEQGHSASHFLQDTHSRHFIPLSKFSLTSFEDSLKPLQSA
jgi:hypothetical protein